MNLNKVFLIGRLTRDPETRTTPSGQMVCSFGLATNRVWTDRETNQKQERTEYHNVVLWRRLAEIAFQYLAKGSLVLVEGRIQTRSWQDSSGNTRYRTEIVGDNIQLGPKASNPTISLDKKSTKEIPPEEIPIIEEDPSPTSSTKSEEKKTPEQKSSSAEASKQKKTSEDKNQDEIDVSQIPF